MVDRIQSKYLLRVIQPNQNPLLRRCPNGCHLSVGTEFINYKGDIDPESPISPGIQVTLEDDINSLHDINDQNEDIDDSLSPYTPNLRIFESTPADGQRIPGYRASDPILVHGLRINDQEQIKRSVSNKAHNYFLDTKKFHFSSEILNTPESAEKIPYENYPLLKQTQISNISKPLPNEKTGKKGENEKEKIEEEDEINHKRLQEQKEKIKCQCSVPITNIKFLSREESKQTVTSSSLNKNGFANMISHVNKYCEIESESKLPAPSAPSKPSKPPKLPNSPHSQKRYFRELESLLDTKIFKKAVPIKLEGGRKGNYKYTLIVDIDETLVYVPVDTKVFYNNGNTIAEPKTTHTQMIFIPRPHLKYFLNSLLRIFEVILYTSGEKSYAEDISKSLGVDPRRFAGICNRNQCHILENGRVLKDLHVIPNREIKEMFIIDDTPDVWELHKEQLFTIPSFQGDKRDRSLLDIFEELIEVFYPEEEE